MLREINLMMSSMIRSLEEKKEEKVKKPFMPPTIPTEQPEKREPQKKTALQVINEMVNARLSQPEVDIFDDHGVRGQGKIPSPEYKLLQERGLEVLSVGIFNPRFNSNIEDIIKQRWSSTWLLNAIAESEQVERKRNLVETTGHEKAIRQYADFLSKDLIQKKPVGIKETLKTFLLRTRALIMNNHQLRQRMNEEQQELEDVIRWIEGGGS
jgi:hypothetical protein